VSRSAGSVLVPGRSPGVTDAGRIRELGGRPLRRRSIARIAAWSGSILMHAVIAITAFLLTWTVVSRALEREAPVVTLMDFQAPVFDPVVHADEQPALPPPVSNPTDAAIAVPPIALRGLDRLPEVAPGDPAARPLAPLAMETAARGASFAGLRATNARRVVYVVDASGSLVGTFPAILRELEASLARLDQRQSFAVVFFQKGEALAVPPGRLMPADSLNISRAIDWMRRSVFPTGRSSPVEALQAAMKLSPDLVFMLSAGITGAGEFEISRDELLRALDRINPVTSRSGRRRTRIQCVQFLERDPGGTLERIAEVHGGPGAFRFLSRDELGLAPGGASGAAVE